MPRFDIRQVEHFVCAARTGSLGKAANELFLSQQALSKSIRALEQSVGVALFHRVATGVTLTRDGEILLDYAQAALVAFNKLERCACGLANGVSGGVSTCIPPTSFKDRGGTIDHASLIRFCAEHPDTTYIFSEVLPSEAVRNVESGEFDFGIGTLRESENLEYVEIGLLPFSVVMDADNPLAKKKEIAVSDLNGKTILSPYQTHEMREKLLKATGQELPEFNEHPIHFRSDNLASILIGTSMLAVDTESYIMSKTSLDGVAVIPFVDDEGRRVAPVAKLFWHSSTHIGKAERDLIDFIVDLYRERQ